MGAGQENNFRAESIFWLFVGIQLYGGYRKQTFNESCY